MAAADGRRASVTAVAERRPRAGCRARGIFSDDASAPSNSPHTHTRVYPDGAVVEYNHAAHALKAELPVGATLLIVAPGSVTVQTQAATVQAGSVTLDAQQTTVTGDMLVKGAFAFESGMTGKGGKGKTIKIDGGAEFSEDVIAAGTSVHGHNHRAQGENAETSRPL
jgi:phage baseplate assembly protein V